MAGRWELPQIKGPRFEGIDEKDPHGILDVGSCDVLLLKLMQ